MLVEMTASLYIVYFIINLVNIVNRDMTKKTTCDPFLSHLFVLSLDLWEVTRMSNVLYHTKIGM